MTSLTEFRSYVALHAAGVPNPVIDREILESAIRFCTATRGWKQSVAIDVVAGTAEYDLAAALTAGVPHVIDEAYHNHQKILARSPDQMREEYQEWATATGTPLYYTTLTPGTVRLAPIPAASLADGLTARITVKPSRSATELPDWLFEEYVDVIASGAIAVLKGNQGLPCFDAQAAMIHAELAGAGTRKAMTRIAKGLTRAPQRVVSHF